MTPRPDTHGWQARIVWDPASFGLDQVLLYVFRAVGPDHREVLTLTETGHPTRRRIEVSQTAVDDGGAPLGIRLPAGVAEAIADAVRPGPSEETMIVLRQQLEVERGRVDRMLDGQVRTRLQPGDRTQVDRPNPTRAS